LKWKEAKLLAFDDNINQHIWVQRFFCLSTAVV
jgi:hypothetical protein